MKKLLNEIIIMFACVCEDIAAMLVLMGMIFAAPFRMLAYRNDVLAFLAIPLVSFWLVGLTLELLGDAFMWVANER